MKFKKRHKKSIISNLVLIPEIDSPCVITLQKGNGPILGFTEQNLPSGGYEEASKFAQKKRLLKAVKVYIKEEKPENTTQNRLR